MKVMGTTSAIERERTRFNAIGWWLSFATVTIWRKTA